MPKSKRERIVRWVWERQPSFGREGDRAVPLDAQRLEVLNSQLEVEKAQPTVVHVVQDLVVRAPQQHAPVTTFAPHFFGFFSPQGG